MPTVSLEYAPVVAAALDSFERGMDFADALQLAAAADCSAFATFDRRLVTLGRTLSKIEVREP